MAILATRWLINYIITLRWVHQYYTSYMGDLNFGLPGLTAVFKSVWLMDLLESNTRLNQIKPVDRQQHLYLGGQNERNRVSLSCQLFSHGLDGDGVA